METLKACSHTGLATTMVRPGTHFEWMDLKALTQYACVSERTIREWIHRPDNPLPAVQVDKKILVRRNQFDQWLEAHRVCAVDIGQIVEEMMTTVRVN